MCAHKKSGNHAKVRKNRQISGSSVQVRTGKALSRIGTRVNVVHTLLPTRRR